MTIHSLVEVGCLFYFLFFYEHSSLKIHCTSQLLGAFFFPPLFGALHVRNQTMAHNPHLLGPSCPPTGIRFHVIPKRYCMDAISFFYINFFNFCSLLLFYSFDIFYFFYLKSKIYLKKL